MEICADPDEKRVAGIESKHEYPNEIHYSGESQVSNMPSGNLVLGMMHL
jgi:hypothetical protein